MAFFAINLYTIVKLRSKSFFTIMSHCCYRALNNNTTMYPSITVTQLTSEAEVAYRGIIIYFFYHPLLVIFTMLSLKYKRTVLPVRSAGFVIAINFYFILWYNKIAVLTHCSPKKFDTTLYSTRIMYDRDITIKTKKKKFFTMIFNEDIFSLGLKIKIH